MISASLYRSAWQCQWDGTPVALAVIQEATGDGEVLEDGSLSWLGCIVAPGSWVFHGDGWTWARTPEQLAEEDPI